METVKDRGGGRRGGWRGTRDRTEIVSGGEGGQRGEREEDEGEEGEGEG